MKNHIDNKVKSYMPMYWIVWAFITLLTLYLKYIYLKGQGSSFNLLVAYALVLWIPIMILNLYEGDRMSKYIKKTYPQECENMKTVSGKIQGKLLWEFAKKNSLNDPMLKQLSRSYKKFIAFALFVLFTIVLLGVIFIIL